MLMVSAAAIVLPNAVGDRYAERDAWARSPVRRFGKQVRQERGQDVLDGRVLVDVADDAQGLELTHLIGAGDRPAEDDDARAMVELANGLEQRDTVALRDAQIEDDQVDSRRRWRGPAPAAPGLSATVTAL